VRFYSFTSHLIFAVVIWCSLFEFVLLLVVSCPCCCARMYCWALLENRQISCFVRTSLLKHFLTATFKLSYNFFKEYSIHCPASSQWHFGIRSTRRSIFLPINWSSDSSTSKSLQLPIRYFKLVCAERHQMHPFYHPQCTGLYCLNGSTLTPKALSVTFSVSPANLPVAKMPTSFSILMSSSFVYSLNCFISFLFSPKEGRLCFDEICTSNILSLLV